MPPSPFAIPGPIQRHLFATITTPDNELPH